MKQLNVKTTNNKTLKQQHTNTTPQPHNNQDNKTTNTTKMQNNKTKTKRRPNWQSQPIWAKLWPSLWYFVDQIWRWKAPGNLPGTMPGHPFWPWRVPERVLRTIPGHLWTQTSKNHKKNNFVRAHFGSLVPLFFYIFSVCCSNAFFEGLQTTLLKMLDHFWYNFLIILVTCSKCWNPWKMQPSYEKTCFFSFREHAFPQALFISSKQFLQPRFYRCLSILVSFLEPIWTPLANFFDSNFRDSKNTSCLSRGIPQAEGIWDTSRVRGELGKLGFQVPPR